MFSYWHSTTMVFNRYTAILIQCNMNLVTISIQCFVNRIVNNFPDQMM